MAATVFTATISGARPPWRPGASTYLDVGTSGGVWGLERGYCMMIGGDKAAVERLDPIFGALAPGIGDIPRPRVGQRDLAPERGYIHAGPWGRATSSRWCTTVSSMA